MNFPQLAVIHTVKGFDLVNKAKWSSRVPAPDPAPRPALPLLSCLPRHLTPALGPGPQLLLLIHHREWRVWLVSMACVPMPFSLLDHCIPPQTSVVAVAHEFFPRDADASGLPRLCAPSRKTGDPGLSLGSSGRVQETRLPWLECGHPGLPSRPRAWPSGRGWLHASPCLLRGAPGSHESAAQPLSCGVSTHPALLLLLWGSRAHILLAALAHRPEWLGNYLAAWAGLLGCVLCGLCHTAGTVGRAPGQSWLQDITALKDKDHLVRGWEPRAGRKTEGATSGESGGHCPQSGGV